MTNLVELVVPDIGDFDEVEVIEVLVSTGDNITENQDIITLESDKASMDIPATKSGTIQELKISVGDMVKKNSLIATILTNEDKTEEIAPVLTNEDKTEEIVPIHDPDSIIKPSTTSQPIITEEKPRPSAFLLINTPHNISTPHASPSVRKFARTLDVNLNKLNGTGTKNRITKEDIENFVKKAINNQDNTNTNHGSGIPDAPIIDFTKFGKISTEPLSRIKKISGKHLRTCWLNIPHVTQFDKADISELEQFRKEHKPMAQAKGINLTPLVFIMKAVVATLQLFKEFNASLSPEKENLIIKHYYNIGVAVDTPNGLIVPVVKDVDKKGFLALAKELSELSIKAREGKLTINDLQGGTFSISSLGGIGGSFFTPIVNAPEVAILGVGRHQTEAIWDGEQFVPKLMLPLSVSYDHRVIDGATGARFTATLAQMLSDIREVLL